MSTAKLTIELPESGKVNLYFGMSAIEVYSNKSVEQVNKLAKEHPKVAVKDLGKFASGSLSFSYVIFAGLCGWADREENIRPKFADAFDMAQEIMEQGDELQKLVYVTFSNSRAHKILQERLNGIQKKNLPEAE